MGYISYTATLTEGVYEITSAKRIVKLSILGKSVTPSTYLGDSTIAGFPAAAAINIANGEKLTDGGAYSGFIQKATLTVPADGSVDVFIEHEPK